jgi:hypothetical protein
VWLQKPLAGQPHSPLLLADILACFLTDTDMDPKYQRDNMDEGITVYLFSDGSKLGTKGRQHHQRWIID